MRQVGAAPKLCARCKTLTFNCPHEAVVSARRWLRAKSAKNPYRHLPREKGTDGIQASTRIISLTLPVKAPSCIWRTQSARIPKWPSRPYRPASPPSANRIPASIATHLAETRWRIDSSREEPAGPSPNLIRFGDRA